MSSDGLIRFVLVVEVNRHLQAALVPRPLYFPVRVLPVSELFLKAFNRLQSR